MPLVVDVRGDVEYGVPVTSASAERSAKRSPAALHAREKLSWVAAVEERWLVPCFDHRPRERGPRKLVPPRTRTLIRGTAGSAREESPPALTSTASAGTRSSAAPQVSKSVERPQLLHGGSRRSGSRRRQVGASVKAGSSIGMGVPLVGRARAAPRQGVRAAHRAPPGLVVRLGHLELDVRGRRCPALGQQVVGAVPGEQPSSISTSNSEGDDVQGRVRRGRWSG